MSNPESLHRNAYFMQQKKLLGAVATIAQRSMANASEELLNTYSLKSGECGVSVDGSWQKRGYFSLNGCVIAISVATGKVLDVEVMSSYCKKLEAKQIKSIKADHVCQQNYSGSASNMEAIGAYRTFNRSEKRRNLKYTSYYGDGYSKGFLQVKDMYGADSVVKMECIGHVQKRVGSNLRKLKNKTAGLYGRGKLTGNFIDRLQNYYGIAIRNNMGNLEAMQENVVAALFHCASSVKKPMHGQCLRGVDSLCYYQRATHEGKILKERYAGLP